MGGRGVSGAGEPGKPTIKPAGRGSAFDDILGEMTERRDPPPPDAPTDASLAAAPDAEPDALEQPAEPRRPGRQAAATAPAQRAAARRAPARPARSGRPVAPPLAASIPMPESLDSGTTRPLNVRVPAGVHFQMKVATLGVATDMQTVVNHLVTVFLRDPQLFMRLVADAGGEGQSLGEWVHEALLTLGGDD